MSIIFSKLGNLVSGYMSPWFSIPILVAFVTVFFNFLYTKVMFGNYNVNAFNRLPGPKLWPIIGSLPDLIVPHENMIQNFGRMFKQYGNVMRLAFGSRAFIFIKGSKGFETVMGSTQHITKGRFQDSHCM